MNVLGVGAPAPASLSSSALHFRLKVTNILPPSPIYHSRTVRDNCTAPEPDIVFIVWTTNTTLERLCAGRCFLISNWTTRE